MGIVTQAVMLAAGRGSRMERLGADRPKALIELAGRSLLDWNLQALAVAGVERLCVIGGWQSDRLLELLQQHPLYSAIRIEHRYNPHWDQAGPLRSLQYADDWLLAAPTLMLYGDCVYAPRVIDAVCRAYDGGCLVPGDRRWSALWALRFAQPLLDAERWRSKDGRLLDIGGRAESLSAESAQFMGLCVFDPSAWQRTRTAIDRWQQTDPKIVDALDITALLRRRIVEGETIHCVELDGGWVELDSQDDHRCIADAMASADKEQTNWSHDVRF